MLTLTQDDFLALGRQLADAAIALYRQALVDHASTVNLPAPTAHPMIEAIVKQHGGQYVVAAPVATGPARDFGAEIDALTAALQAKAVVTSGDMAAAAATLSRSE